MDLSKKVDARINNKKPFGVPHRKYYKWSIVMFDKATNQIKNGKYSTIKELNEDLGLNLNNDLAYRLHTNYRAVENSNRKENSFYNKYGHIQLTKIKELRI